MVLIPGKSTLDAAYSLAKSVFTHKITNHFFQVSPSLEACIPHTPLFLLVLIAQGYGYKAPTLGTFI